jgi:LmbE family N-acetylglucosaminyl deacetylase
MIRVIAFGAHPDDCEICAGGTAIKFVRGGHAVKFVSVTNGDAGHQSEGGGALAQRRRAESLEAARRLGVECEVLDNHDGELAPSVAVREQIIRAIRRWNADIVMGPRPNDYHPDHRNTGLLVQDAAYMVTVPNLCPDTPALKTNPLFLYFEDRFQRPNPFRPDIVIGIEDVFEQKMFALDAHVSQVYEWLPWLDGRLDEIPKDPAERREWLAAWFEKVVARRDAEAFEICEYGRLPGPSELGTLFPMLGE